MRIRVGYEIIYDFPQPTPLILVMGIHFTRASDVIVPDYLTTDPPVLTDPTNFRVEDAVCDSSGEFIPPTGQSRRSGFAGKLSQPDSVEAPPVFGRVRYR